MNRWVALLRGINVGGGNRLAMAELRATAEQLGWTGVATYIQSGNLVFAADGDEGDLASALVGALRDRHDLTVPVVLRPADELVRIAEAHPSLGSDVEPRFLQVLVLDRSPDPGVVDRVAPDAYGADTWTLDGREIYAMYPNGSGRSKLTIEVFERAWGVMATGRNVNTMRKLADLVRG